MPSSSECPNQPTGAASAFPHPITVLLVEDHDGDARLVELLVQRDGGQLFQLTRVTLLSEALARLGGGGHFDVALLDLSLPDSFGLDTLDRLRQGAPLLPIVVLTGNADTRMALQAVQRGAQDYLVKGEGDGETICRSIRYAVERAALTAHLRRSEAQFRAVFEHAGLGIGLLDGEGRLLSANAALAGMLGDAAAPLSGQPLASFAPAEDRPALCADLGALLAGEQDLLSRDLRFRAASGQLVWGRANVSLVRGGDGQPQFAVGMIEDITARKNSEEQLRLAAKVLEATGEGVFVTDAGCRIVHVNPSFTGLTGYSAAEVLGESPKILSSGRHDLAFYEAMWCSLRDRGYWRGEIWNRKKNGEIFAEWINISAVRDEAGLVSHYVAVFSDITDRKQSEERLSYQAHHDPLTGLPNRLLFLERLERALARARRNTLVVGVLFLDLDHFKQINDSLGHLAGDSLLQQVAERLQNCVRQEDTVARLAGDEFTLILEDIGDFRAAATVAQKVLGQFALSFLLNGRPARISTSIGISLYPSDGADVTTLLRAADEAMYVAKKQGRNSFRFASPELSAQAFQRQALEIALRHAVDDGSLELHYQPIVGLSGQAGAGQVGIGQEGGGQAVIGVEALIRWRHPELGLLAPHQFLPLATETGAILALGRWVVETALRQLADWRATGYPTLRLGINISKAELHHPDFLAHMQASLRAARLPAEALDMEIPAALVMDGGAATLRAVDGLRAHGIGVVLDDFGTGRTDFRQLRATPVDTVKIAAEFIRDVAINSDEARLVRTTATLAHSMNLKVIAKAVETTDQYDFLRHHHCDGAQGFFFSRPLPAEDLPAFLAGPRS